jgi:hypothetical protein
MKLPPHIADIKSMAHSPVRNYAIPGLTSWLIGSGPGKVRLFECSRSHDEHIVPHSHRFAFSCQVLRGRVWNKTFKRVETGGDEFLRSTITYTGEIGQHTIKRGGVARYDGVMSEYGEGDWYSMEADEVHSIWFDRDTMVLFFEGPNVSNESIILEPFVDGDLIPTFKVEPWMFARPNTAQAGGGK